MKKLVSIVVPAFNEENNVARTYSALVAETDLLAERYDFEFVFIDDCSTDGTFVVLKELASKDPRLKVFRFSKNYGFQRAVHTGYAKCKGDAAIQMDADLQDPTDLIPAFIAQWELGHQVVYGIRRTRKEGLFITLLRRIFYWLISKLSQDNLPRDAGDCRLVDRRLIDILSKINDTHIYVRGRISSMGFSQVGVPYDRQAREFDESKFGLVKLAGLAMDGIVSHSVLPLRLATVLGMLMMVLAVGGIAMYGIGKLFFDAEWPPGFATTVVLLLFGMGLNGLFVGVLGEYVARIYAQLKIPSEPVIEITLNDGEC